MDPILLLIPILLPVFSGFAMLLYPIRETPRRNSVVMALALLNSALVFLLLATVGRETAQVYSFIELFSIQLHVDDFSALFAGMLAFLWPPALLYAYDYMENAPRQNQFFAFYLMTYGVALGVAFSANLVTMYLFYEMLTLVTLPLVTHNEDEDSLHAGRSYIVYCVFGAALAFVAVVVATLDGGGEFVYGGKLAGRFDPELLRWAFMLGFFGFGAKAALFPLYSWLPTASVAPTPVTALLHAVAVVNAGMFSVTRLVWYAFGPSLLMQGGTRELCIAASSFSMVFAAAMALRQRHFKRRLAFSTMSNLSYMIFGISLMTPAGLLGGLAHMLFHSIIKMSLFLCAGAVMHVSGREYIYELDGLGREMPVTFTCYTLGALSLSGIPLFCGFVSKWRLLLGGVELGTSVAWVGVAALLAAAFLCAIYTLSVSIRAFFPAGGASGRAGEAPASEASWRMLFPIVLFTLLNLLFGIWQKPVIRLLSAIANGVY